MAHKITLAIHPTKSWQENNWSHLRRRFYKKTVRFIYCIDCKQWGWGLPANHNLYTKSDKTYRGKVDG